MTQTFATVVKRHVVFHGLGKTCLKAPPSYHSGKIIKGTESIRKPDGLATLYDNEQQAKASLERTDSAKNPNVDAFGIRWNTSLLIIEHNLPKGPIPDPGRAGIVSTIAGATHQALVRDDILLASYAKEALCALGNRTHVFGLLLNRCHAAFWYFDRSGAIRSEDISISISKLDLLARFLTALTFADSETIGFSPHFTPPAGLSPNSLDALAPPTLTGFSIPYEGGSVVLDKIISSQCGLVGRGTLVYSANIQNSGVDADKDVVAKLAWQVITRRDEWEWVDEAVQSGRCTQQDFPIQYGHRVFAGVRRGLRGRFGLNGVGEDRELRLFVMERISLVKELRDPAEVLSVFRRYIEILYNLHDANIYHRNIGINKLGFRRVSGEVVAVVFDFAHAQRVHRDKEGTTSQHVTGTLPFMALDLLDDLSAPHLVRFDAESVMWVLWWLVLEPDDTNSAASTIGGRILKKWCSGSLDSISDSKTGFLVARYFKVKPLRHCTILPQLLQLTRRFSLGFDEIWPLLHAGNAGSKWETLGGHITRESLLAAFAAIDS
ncbi:hypothetical protein FRB99_003616 [Tulasnella sp. 403]|nr:hypothetical protein FRB99_003616 [Tulasnella sp. 403]